MMLIAVGWQSPKNRAIVWLLSSNVDLKKRLLSYFVDPLFNRACIENLLIWSFLVISRVRNVSSMNKISPFFI